jgi:hypothetical protein
VLQQKIQPNQQIVTDGRNQDLARKGLPSKTQGKPRDHFGRESTFLSSTTQSNVFGCDWSTLDASIDYFTKHRYLARRVNDSIDRSLIMHQYRDLYV